MPRHESDFTKVLYYSLSVVIYSVVFLYIRRLQCETLQLAYLLWHMTMHCRTRAGAARPGEHSHASFLQCHRKPISSPARCS